MADHHRRVLPPPVEEIIPLQNLNLTVVPGVAKAPPPIVGALLSQLDQIVHEAVIHKDDVRKPAVKPSVFSSLARRVWCQSPKPEYTLETQKYNLPSRCVPLVRPDIDLIILPGNHPPTREFFDFCKQTLGIREQQAVWTRGFVSNMDDDVDECVLDLLRRLMSTVLTGVTTSGSEFVESWVLMPYCATKNFQRWAGSIFLGGPSKLLSSTVTVSTFGETDAWMSKYGDKGILHRHVNTPDVPCMIELIDPTIAVPRGYVCETVTDLLKAREMLLTQCCNCFAIKPLSGATGKGIILMPTLEILESYTFPMGVVSLEEFLVKDEAPDGTSISPALHYVEHSLLGNGMVDQIMKGTRYIGWRTSSTSREFQEEAVRVMKKFISHTNPCGAGGVDFLSVAGKPVLVDINTGRFNGAHAPKLFQQMYAPDSELYCWKQKPDPNLTVFAVWQRLQDAGIAFQPKTSRSGVFPILFLRGLSSMFVAFGEYPGQAEELKNRAYAFVQPPTPLMPPAAGAFQQNNTEHTSQNHIGIAP
eukprot:c6454_g1_i1.p1 GENE.c6454_g1_i1~~c6454_g1_i1.p1  ORF type:complete len:531 (+),score=60.06 c6454_g1_i1:212-1804(+)